MRIVNRKEFLALREEVIEKRVCISLGSHGQRYHLYFPNSNKLTKWCDICDELVTTWYYNPYVEKPRYVVVFHWDKTRTVNSVLFETIDLLPVIKPPEWGTRM